MKIDKFSLNVIETCESTNDELIKLGKQGINEGYSILSYHQTKGRGSKNRTWLSPKGNIYLSTLIKPKTKKINWNQISLLSGLSVMESLIQLGISQELLKIKWPNDILINLKKVCGILVESFDNFVVVGIGLNVNSYPKNIDSKLDCTDLSSFGQIKENDLLKITNLILKTFFSNYISWSNFLLKPLLNKINENLAFKNSNIIFEYNGSTLKGILLEIDENGLLKVLFKKKVLKILSSDFTIIKQGDGNAFSN